MNNNIQIPDHSPELFGCNEKLEYIKQQLKGIENFQSFPPNMFQQLYSLAVRILEKTADLSMSAFDIRDELEEQIFHTYKSNPELAKQMFCSSYEGYHKPYNKIKNRCYSVIEQMESLYFLINKRKPYYKGE